MQKHTQIYFNHFDYTIADYVPSEISGRHANVVHHIHRRGMGRNENMDRIENLMALTDHPGDSEHREYGDIKEFKGMLYKIHKARLKALGKPFDEAWIDLQIEKYPISETNSHIEREHNP